MNRRAERQYRPVLYSGQESIRLTGARITRPLACLPSVSVPPARFLPSTEQTKKCLAYWRRSTRDSSYQSSHPPRVCLYLPSCRRTHPAPCIRSPLALTRLLCGLPAAHRLAAPAAPSQLPARPARTNCSLHSRCWLVLSSTSTSALPCLCGRPPVAPSVLAARSSLGNVQAHPQRHQPKHHDHPPMPIVPQHPSVASRHSASLARPSTRPPVRQLRASL